MSERILELDRKENTVRVYKILYPGFKEYYMILQDVTHVIPRGCGWVDLYTQAGLRGFVTHIKEIKEKW